MKLEFEIAKVMRKYTLGNQMNQWHFLGVCVWYACVEGWYVCVVWGLGRVWVVFVHV